MQDLKKLDIFTLADARKILKVPGHYRGEIGSRRLRYGAPLVHAHRLPGRLPVEVRRRDRTGRGADVVAKGKQRVKLGKEVGMSGTALCYIELGEGRIAIDEGRAWNRDVFVAPEPATAGKVEEKVGIRADTPPRIAGPAVIS